MQFNPIPTENIKALGRVVESAKEVRGHAVTLVELLRACFAAQGPKQRWGVDFDVAADQISADINTVFGSARAGLNVQFVDGAYIGRYVIEKQVKGAQGQVAWVPVWAILIDGNGGIRAGDTGLAVFNVWHDLGGESTGAVHHLAGSILYSIASADGHQDQLN